MLEHALMSVTRLRHHVVRQVTGVRDLLDTNSDLMQTKLSVGLEALYMGHERILVDNWACRRLWQ